MPVNKRRKKPSLDKVVSDAMRKVLKPRSPRRKRAKTEADVRFEEMLADYKKNGAAHLASARKKLGLD